MFAVYPEDSSDVTFDQDTLLLVQNSNDKFTVRWEPQSLLPLLEPSSFTVNIALYQLDTSNTQEWMHFLDITRGHPNTGVAEFTVPNSNEIIAPAVYPVALRVSVGAHSQEDGILQSFNDLVVFAQDAVSQWRSNLNYAVSLNLLDRCLEWYQTQPPDIGNTILSRVPDCCQTEEKATAPNSGFIRDSHDALVAFFHPDAASCYRQATIIRFVCFMPVHSL